MSFLSSIDISASALTAQRMRMDVISENIANADTTRTANGGPTAGAWWRWRSSRYFFGGAEAGHGNGVTGGGGWCRGSWRICRILSTNTTEPSDADENG